MQKATRTLGKIKKHVALIHCSSDLGLLQRKIANILLHNAISYGQRSDKYEISLKSLITNSNYDSNDYKYLKTITFKIDKNSYRVNLFMKHLIMKLNGWLLLYCRMQVSIDMVSLVMAIAPSFRFNFFPENMH